MRVLVVEDDERVRRMVQRALEERGHAVAALSDAEAALGACRDSAFDLAVLDMALPGLDGLALCRRLRGTAAGAATAVLVVTGVVARADLPVVLDSGADDFLAKPFRFDELGVRLTVLERLASERARRAEAERVQARLLEATQRVAASLDLEETLGAVADEALRLTEADVAVVARPAPDGAHWARLAARGPLAWHWDWPPMGLVGQGAFATALTGGRTVNVADYLAPGAPPQGPRGRGAGIRSVLAVPLRAGAALLGVFGAQSRRPGHFTPARQRLLEGLAEAAALAVGHAQEVAQRKEAEARLRASEERFRALVANVPGAVYRCALDEHWTLHFVSDFVEQIVGYPAAEFVGSGPRRTWASVIHPDDRAAVDAAVRKGVARREPFVMEYRVLHADGRERWVHERGRGVFADDGRVAWLDGVVLDATDQRLAERERDVLRDRLARAEERERIAMDLHDVGVQSLFGLSMRLAAVRRVGGIGPEAREALAAAETSVAAAMEHLRGHVRSLLGAPPAPPPDGGSVRAALEAVAGEVAGGTDLTVYVGVDPAADEALPAAAAEHVLHAAREALANAARHGGARRAVVRLARRRGRVVLTVRDDGRGFDPSAARTGMGLANMRRRAELVGGVVAVASAPGRGTVVRLEVPVPRDAGRQRAAPTAEERTGSIASM